MKSANLQIIQETKNEVSISVNSHRVGSNIGKISSKLNLLVPRLDSRFVITLPTSFKLQSVVATSTELDYNLFSFKPYIHNKLRNLQIYFFFSQYPLNNSSLVLRPLKA